MLLFHYVLYFARRATILLYMLVLLSTRAVNEQSDENERKKENESKNRRERCFFGCQHYYQGWFAPTLCFSGIRKKKNERKRNDK
jgi:hypothetical protein